MARSEGGGNGTSGTRRVRALVVPALACAVLAVAGCSGDSSREPPPQTRAVALHVKTVYGADAFDEDTRTDLETQVGDVLSKYVVGAFLGKFPRENFVGSFDSFTSGTARSAAGDIDLLTASRFSDATAVRATRLDAWLSFLAPGKDAFGATARVRFGFEASLPGSGTREISLRGRFMLVQERGTWSVFGYDVARDDGGRVQTGESP